MLETLVGFGKVVVFPVARSVAGWAENALADNFVSEFEWKELGKTVIRVGSVSAALFFGFNGFGVNVDVLATGAAAFIVDWAFCKVAKIREAKASKKK